MSDPSSQPTQPPTDDELERIRDLAYDDIATVRDMRLVLGELERLHSWDGLMELLDEKWPEDIFPTREDDTARDPGPRIVSLLRWNIRLRRELHSERERLNDALAENVRRLGEITGLRTELRGCRNLGVEYERLRVENIELRSALGLDQNEEGQANGAA